jgi:hypothetical protein
MKTLATGAVGSRQARLIDVSCIFTTVALWLIRLEFLKTNAHEWECNDRRPAGPAPLDGRVAERSPR